jgi:hypothetical protein
MAVLIARVCGLCRAFVKGDAPCDCKPLASKRAQKYASVQVGYIDGEQVGYFPRGSGPYIAPGKSLKRVLKNKRQWTEYIKRQEGKIVDAS